MLNRNKEGSRVTAEEEERPRLDAPPKKLSGPPKREFKEGERVALSLRMTPALKRRLDAMAERGGRSQSQQAEFMLERSFERHGLLAEALSLSYGSRTAGFLMMLGRLMQLAASTEGPLGPGALHYDWTENPSSAALGVVAAVIDGLLVPPKKGSDTIPRLIAEMGRLVGSPKYARRIRDELLRGEIDTIRQLVGRSMGHRLATAKPAKRRGKWTPPSPGTGPSEQAIEATSHTIADAILNLVHSTPHTPTRGDIASVVSAHLNAQKERRNG
jgi:hypothetical protein